MAIDKNKRPFTIPLTGRLNTRLDPTGIGADFQKYVNMRPQKGGPPEGVLGMSKINTSTADATYARIKNGFHFRKGNGETHVLVQGWNSDETAAAVLQNRTAIPSQGAFEATDLFTDDTSGGVGYFSKAPAGGMAYANGEDVCAFGGDEFNAAAVIQYDPDDSKKKWDFTRNLTNSDADDNVALVKTGGTLDSYDKLLLHFDSNLVDTIGTHTPSDTDHTVSYDSFNHKHGTAAASFGIDIAPPTVWTERANPKNFTLYDVAWNGSLFCAVGYADGADAYIVTSPDGVTWTERANPKNVSLNDVVWTGSLFCAVGAGDGVDAYIVTSPDGVTWTEQTNPKNFMLYSVAWTGSLFCAVGNADGGDAYIVTSPDGTTWTERANPKNITLYDVIWTGSLLCAVGYQDGGDAYIVTSPDGVVWTEQTNPKNVTLYGITWTGSLLCAVGAADGVDAYIVTSPDGVTWTERANPKNITLYDVAWTGSLLCAVGAGDGGDAYIVTSPDGGTWTEQTNPKNVTLYGITWTGSLFCAVGAGDGVDAYIVTSPAEVIWTERANPKNVALNGVVWTGSLLCAVGYADGGDAYIVTSPDGVVWTERANPKNVTLYAVTWTGSLLCAVGNGDGGDAYIVTSPDGVTWTERANPKNVALYGVVWTGSLLCAVGQVDGGDAYIVTSPDGIVAWTERANPKNVALLGVAWTGSLLCAVGYADGVDAYIVTSPDGVTWTERANPKNVDLYGVAWTGSLLCAVGQVDGGDAYIVTSPDGVTWTERANPKNKPLYGVAWTGSLLCAVGNADGGDAYIVTSPDGVTWTERANPKNVTLWAIVWTGSLLCAVGWSDGGDAYIVTSNKTSYVTIPVHADFNFSAGNMTIDFCVKPKYLMASNTIYYQQTDADNYIRVSINTSNHVVFSIYSTGAPAVTMTSVSALAVMEWAHVAIAESGDNYYMFINGSLDATVSDTDRAASYTGSVYIGNDNNAGIGEPFTGDIDEFRVSNGIARWTAGFFPPASAYPVSSVEMFVGSIMPIDGIKFYVETANADTTASASGVYLWNGNSWEAATTLSDGTISGSAILGKTGFINFDTTEDSAKIRPIDNMVFYWYRVQFQSIDNTTEISQVTVSMPFQRMKDVWGGVMRTPLAFMMWDQSTQQYREMTVNVYEDQYDPGDAATFADLGTAFDEANDYLLVGFTERQTGVSFRLVSDKVNISASSIGVSYWDGEQWVTAGGVIDNTYDTTTSATLNKSGIICWSAPDADDERPRQDLTIRRTAPERKYNVVGDQTYTTYTIGEETLSRKAGRRLEKSVEKQPFESCQYEYPLYIYKFSFTGTVSDNVQIYNIGGITAQNEIEDYAFPFFHLDRLFLCNNTKRNGNGVIVSSVGTMNVFNGEDSFNARFGDDMGLTAAASVCHPVQDGISRVGLFFKTCETWILRGSSPSTFTKIQLSDSIGCVARLTMVVADIDINKVQSQVAIWQGANGIYMSDGRKPVSISTDIDDLFDTTSSNYVDPDYAHLSSGWYDAAQNEYHWCFRSNGAAGSPPPTPLDSEWVFNLDTGQWYEMDRGTGNALQCGIPVKDSNGQTYTYGCDAGGYMYRLENGQNFDGEDIVHTLHTGDMFLTEDPGYETRIRGVRLVGIKKTTTTNKISMAHYGDTSLVASVDGDGNAASDISPADSKRVYDVVRSVNYGPHTFHSIRLEFTTNNETKGFQPLFLTLLYTVERLKEITQPNN